MKKKIPTIKSEAPAERFVRQADLTHCGLSRLKPVPFKALFTGKIKDVWTISNC
jgi:hypothetical protein